MIGPCCGRRTNTAGFHVALAARCVRPPPSSGPAGAAQRLWPDRPTPVTQATVPSVCPRDRLPHFDDHAQLTRVVARRGVIDAQEQFAVVRCLEVYRLATGHSL